MNYRNTNKNCRMNWKQYNNFDRNKLAKVKRSFNN